MGGTTSQNWTMKKQQKKTKTFAIGIEKLVHGGAGFARREGQVVFVPFSVPGDRLLVRPVEDKKTFIRAEIVRILRPGPGRVDPACPYFARCGGCHWQQLDYSRQVEAKRQILEEVFHHRFPQTRELPIGMRVSAQPFAYRSRARIQLRGSGAKASVGFFRRGSHAVEDVACCPLFRPSLNEALSSLRQYTLRVAVESGSREMDMACSEEENTWATVHTGPDADEGTTVLFGTRRREGVLLRRKIGDFIYSVTAATFFQSNDFVVPELVSTVMESARDSGGGLALDLFSGVGLFSLPLARQFARVITVENSPEASRLCSRNAAAAGLGNVQPVCADVSAWLQSAGAADRPIDLIVLDPPRTGAGGVTMDRIRDARPNRIIYVSCDPQTLVRDLARISPHDYTIRRIEGLDMFPQTYHFETVVELEKN